MTRCWPLVYSMSTVMGAGYVRSRNNCLGFVGAVRYSSLRAVGTTVGTVDTVMGAVEAMMFSS